MITSEVNLTSQSRLELLHSLASGEAECSKFYKTTGGSLKARLSRLFFYPRIFAANALTSRGMLKKHVIVGTTFWGRKMRLQLGDRTGALPIYFFGVLADKEDSKLTRFFLKNLDPEDVFYDIGTNWGFYAYLAHDLLTAGEVHAFEPLPELFGFVKKNTEGDLGARLIANNFALWSQAGDLSFFDQSNAGHSGASTAVEAVAAQSAAAKLTVQASTLDEYVKTHRLPTILKIDVEGGERHVIQGGRDFLKNHDPVVVMEVWAGEMGQSFSKDAVEMICALGYTPHLIDMEGEISVLKPNVVDQIERTENIVFKKL